MRPLELSAILAAVPYLVWPFRQGLRRLRGLQFLPGIAFLLTVLQVWIEGYRWQMLPAYAAVTVTLLLDIGSLLSPFRFGRAARWTLLGGLAAAATLGTVYPVFELPRPRGPYPIGTLSYHLIDPSRPEELSSKPGGHREVMIQVWYPAASSARGTYEPYRTRRTATGRWAYLTLIKTHAIDGAAISRSGPGFPVVLYSPSWHGERNQDMFEVEDLVSHGFIVVGVDHPYGSGITVFPDGRVVAARPDLFLDCSTENTLRHSLEIANQQVRIRAADLIFVLNALAGLNHGDPRGILTGRLDLNRVGVLGYSFGGAVAVQASWLDTRFKAAIDLDGMLFGESAETGISQPFLIMSAQPAPPFAAALTSGSMPHRRWVQVVDEQTREIHRFMVSRGGYELNIAGFDHGNFSDGALFSPIPWLADSGTVSPGRAMAIVNAYTIAFFRKFLMDVPQPLLDRPASKYPEAKLIVYAPRCCSGVKPSPSI